MGTTQSIVVNGTSAAHILLISQLAYLARVSIPLKPEIPDSAARKTGLVRYNRGPKTNLSFVGLPPMMLIVNLLLQKYI